MPRLLLTNNHLANYGGSEMVALELAEEFADRGWHVDVFTNYADEPFRSEFEKLAPGGLVRLHEAEAPRTIDHYDLLWVQHGVLPEAIIDSLRSRPAALPLVWHHMSTLPGIESPVLADIEAAVASLSSFNSAETRDALLQYGLPENRTELLPNPAPRPFTEESPPAPASSDLATVLLVSNHPPAEMTEAIEALAASGVAVRRVGGDAPARVTPETFRDVDAVVTIGKTAQYALCLGIPVYIYDHLGGDGWLGSDDFETACLFNFSGRPTKRRISGAAIAREIIEGYDAARAFSAERIQEHRDRFSLRNHVDALLERLADESTPKHPLSAAHAKRWTAYAKMQRDNTRAIHGAWKANEELQHSAPELQKTVAELTDANAALRRSRSYRLGHALLRPLSRLLRR
ncbi:glycosyltransferase [Leucobacter sp. CSA1]|uniref:Glycosyltransferase n=1 Tax=Leucobacter chromiisoli TaxID=2796471 RepID=A0A934Q6N9_9MICO|nr:glycosyltransferase [Leucobacter chromiisoli]MBK0417669.1 glycosyltransferase [Leucobacter chromiisoli]